MLFHEYEKYSDNGNNKREKEQLEILGLTLCLEPKDLFSSGYLQLDFVFFSVSSTWSCIFKIPKCTVFSARYNIYISRLYYTMSVSIYLSIHLFVMEVHCGHGACREEGRGHLALC